MESPNWNTTNRRGISIMGLETGTYIDSLNTSNPGPIKRND